MDKEEFGQYLKKLRKEKGLTLIELADITDVSNPYISQIENGKFLPSPEILTKLSKGLGVSPVSLLVKSGHLDEETSNDIQSSAMQRHYEKILGMLAETIKLIDEDSSGQLLEKRKRAEDSVREVEKQLKEQIEMDSKLSDEEIEIQNKYVSGEIDTAEYQKLLEEKYDLPNLEAQEKILLDEIEELEKQAAETEKYLKPLLGGDHDLLEFLGKEKVSFMGKEISNSDKLKITRVIASILIDHAPDQTDLVVYDLQKERRIIIDFHNLVESKKD